ncbi:hypothetical protein B0H14DRAFT_2655004 [Mycena olivaceomarginata]|nr:hypothetical protein B0H14DRAFT_2655004 [Mycena olivaceomarginata]
MVARVSKVKKVETIRLKKSSTHLVNELLAQTTSSGNVAPAWNVAGFLIWAAQVPVNPSAKVTALKGSASVERRGFFWSGTLRKGTRSILNVLDMGCTRLVPVNPSAKVTALKGSASVERRGFFGRGRCGRALGASLMYYIWAAQNSSRESLSAKVTAPKGERGSARRRWKFLRGYCAEMRTGQLELRKEHVKRLVGPGPAPALPPFSGHLSRKVQAGECKLTHSGFWDTKPVGVIVVRGNDHDAIRVIFASIGPELRCCIAKDLPSVVHGVKDRVGALEVHAPFEVKALRQQRDKLRDSVGRENFGTGVGRDGFLGVSGGVSGFLGEGGEGGGSENFLVRVGAMIHGSKSLYRETGKLELAGRVGWRANLVWDKGRYLVGIKRIDAGRRLPAARASVDLKMSRIGSKIPTVEEIFAASASAASRSYVSRPEIDKLDTIGGGIVYVRAALEEHEVASTSPPSDRSLQLDDPLRCGASRAHLLNMSDLPVYRPLRLQAYQEMSGWIWREYMRYIEKIILAWSLREARAQSRRELEAGRAQLRRQIVLANEYLRAA